MHELVSAIPEMRMLAESLMVDTGSALRPTGGYEYVDGKDVEAVEALFGPVRCKIQDGLGAVDAEVGGRTAVETRPRLHLPASTPPLTTGDLWEMTDTHPLSLEVVGTRYRIVAPVSGTLKTARRYEVEVVVT